MANLRTMAEDATQAWRETAGDWLTWARTPGLDVAFWELNLPWLERLLPGPDRLPSPAAVVDIGCGEGRVGRVLAERGHQVRGLDSSRLLADAARDGGGYVEVVNGDATALPWAQDSFDLAVAFMTLMDMPDPVSAISETARVLRPGGWFCLAIGHPYNRSEASRVSYFEEFHFDETVARGGVEMRFIGTDRPLSAYTGALAASGFAIEELSEPRPGADWPAHHPEIADAYDTPFFLHIRARLC